MPIDKVIAGQKFSPRATTWNAFVDTANRALSNGINTGATPGNMPVGGIRVLNTSEHDAPRFGIAKLTGLEFKGLHQIERPEYPGISMAVVLAEPVAASTGVGLAIGCAGVEHTPVLCSAYADLAIGARIGAQQGSYYAMADELGAWVVTGVWPVAEQPTGLPVGSGLVMAVYTGQRGDHIILDADAVDSSLSGVYQAVIWGPEYGVSKTSYGVTAVDGA